MSRHFKTEIELEPEEERSPAALGVFGVLAALVGRM
jgi:hypothetical protein